MGDYLSLLLQFADLHNNKFYKIMAFLYFISLNIISSFWGADYCGYRYNGSELTFINTIHFIDSYSILIPFFTFIISFLFYRYLTKLITLGFQIFFGNIFFNFFDQ